MIYARPNAIESLMREIGDKNQEDIWDIEPFEETINNTPDRITTLPSAERLTPEQEEVLADCTEFAHELTMSFREEFLWLVQRYAIENQPIPETILSYIQNKQFEVPTFVIAQGSRASALLEELDFTHWYKDSTVVVFQLPKPLAKFWWKNGDNSWGYAGGKVSSGVVAWGDFYRGIMPVVWSTQGKYANEKSLDFSRANPVGKHDPERYYYIWQVRRR